MQREGRERGVGPIHGGVSRARPWEAVAESTTPNANGRGTPPTAWKPRQNLAMPRPRRRRPTATRLFRFGSTSLIQRRLFRVRRKEKRALSQDLSQWLALGNQRRLMAEADDLDWATRAARENLSIDRGGYRRHTACAKYIAKHALQRGQAPWQRASTQRIGAVDSWADYEQAARMPREDDPVLCDVASDCLSFPLTAAYAARIAGVSPRKAELSLLILGAEVGSELGSLPSKWGELLGGSHGFQGLKRLNLIFVGPEIPEELDGTVQVDTTPHDDGDGSLRSYFLRGLWHEVYESGLPEELARCPIDLALCFNSGLAEHADDWLPTLRHLYWGLRIPICCTSYHRPEGELDARTLAVRLGVSKSRLFCEPNPFASRLPHLDQIFPGRTYVSNAYLSVARGYW